MWTYQEERAKSPTAAMAAANDEWNLVVKGDKVQAGTFKCTCPHCNKTWTGSALCIRGHFGAESNTGVSRCSELNKPEDQQSESLKAAVTICKAISANKAAEATKKAADDARRYAAAQAQKVADAAAKHQLRLDDFTSPSGKRRKADEVAVAFDDATMLLFARHAIPFHVVEVLKTANPLLLSCCLFPAAEIRRSASSSVSRVGCSEGGCAEAGDRDPDCWAQKAQHHCPGPCGRRRTST